MRYQVPAFQMLASVTNLIQSGTAGGKSGTCNELGQTHGSGQTSAGAYEVDE